MSLEVATSFDQFCSLGESWNHLLSRCREESIFLRHEWLRCWWKAFGGRSKLVVPLVRGGDGLVGAAPLMLRTVFYRGLPARVISFVENDNTFRSDFLYSPGHEDVVEVLLESLLRRRSEWDMIVLNNIAADSPTCGRLLEAAASRRLLCHVRPGLRSPFLEIDRSWSEFMSSKSRKFKKTVNNWRNRLSRIGQPEFQELEDCGDLPATLGALFRVSERSWKGAHGRSMEVDRGNRLFFRLLTHVAAEKKWLRIWLLTVNGRPAAFEYHLRYNGDEIAMRSDFDERLRDSSPGSNLDAYVVQTLFEQGVRKYDMGGNCDSYKLRWTDSYRPHTCFYLFGTHAYARLLYLVDVSLVESLKRFPGVSDLAKRVRKLARGLVKFRP